MSGAHDYLKELDVARVGTTLVGIWTVFNRYCVNSLSYRPFSVPDSSQHQGAWFAVNTYRSTPRTDGLAAIRKPTIAQLMGSIIRCEQLPYPIL